MKIVIVGGGKLGYYLTRSLTDYGHEVVVIEKNKTNSMIIADELGANVICADGTEIDVLIAAGINKAECLVAVTGQDQDNLVAAQLAKEKFKIKKVIARANNPRNLEVLTRLGIENAVSSTDIITRMIEQEIDRDELSLIATLNKGRAAICAIKVPKNANINGSLIKDISLPKSSLIISIVRDEQLIIPKGNDIIMDDDEVVAICECSSQKEIREIFTR